jgi:molybdenum cofactor cytidylyltransferase
MSVVGVLLAAGRARRMGRTKQLLPWPPPDGSSTMAAASFDVLAPFCDTVIVVLGHDVSEVRAALGSRPFDVVMSDGEREMFESVRKGLDAAYANLAMHAVLLHAADHPAVRPPTIERLLAIHRDRKDRVILPRYGGRGGHPVLVPREFVPGILCERGDGGLRAHWERLGGRVERVDVNDAGVTHDVDTPQDYVQP